VFQREYTTEIVPGRKVRMAIHDYKSLRAAVIICDTQTTAFDRLLAAY